MSLSYEGVTKIKVRKAEQNAVKVTKRKPTTLMIQQSLHATIEKQTVIWTRRKPTTLKIQQFYTVLLRSSM